MTNATYLITSPKIDLTEWIIVGGPGPRPDPKEDLTPHAVDRILGHLITSVVTGEFEKEPPDVTLPFQWIGADTDGHGGKDVSDPLTFDIELPLSNEELGGPVWRITFRELFDGLINEMVEMTGFPFNEDDVPMLREFAKALRNEAKRIDNIIKHGPEKWPDTGRPESLRDHGYVPGENRQIDPKQADPQTPEQSPWDEETPRV